MTRTLNSPLHIAEISTPSDGLIGVTFAPGKKGASNFGGSHNRDLNADLDVIAKWNAAAVVTLVENHELEELDILDLEDGVIQRFMEWHHLPIVDVSVPDANFERTWPEQSAKLRALLANGANILVHCRGGLGRAGMIAARLLVEMGVDADAAIKQVRAKRPGAIETPAQEQWVKKGKLAQLATAISTEAIRNRAAGALVGLAVGDAVGTTLEFKPKPSRPILTDMVGGGPFELKPGQWTDDTAMALALADWLANEPDFDPAGLTSRFVRWYENGEYSCTGTCFDIGNATRAALDRFIDSGGPLAGSKNPRSAGNGALMRLSPVAIRFWNERERLAEIAEVQTLTTHGADECVDASVKFAHLLADVISGKPLSDGLRGNFISGGDSKWRGVHRNEIRGTGYVVNCLNAALWAVSRTTNFRSAILLAANLGDDADTTAAVAGQLAGALYGLSGIPSEWLERLAWRSKIEAIADQLFRAGSAMGGAHE
jgi:ADP-ribosyl-[dinitrogen reductase] hydrolase